MKKNYIKILILILSLLLLIIWISWSNLTVETTYYKISDREIPESFNGYKIAQISDFHNATYGQDNSTLLALLKEEQPDIIVITGDFVDSDHTDIDVAVSLARKAVKIAPCYYVTGNHEGWMGNDYTLLEAQLTNCGVIFLHNRQVTLQKGNDSIGLIGIDDPDFAKSQLVDNVVNGYKILLTHRPENFNTYADYGINLVLCGHAHGGQVRIPFIGGLVAPDQGFFPTYDAGLFTRDNTVMVVSRGIGNSILPLRINNRPELVVLTLT